jgi:iron complex transport system ATP-binding protein
MSSTAETISVDSLPTTPFFPIFFSALRREQVDHSEFRVLSMTLSVENLSFRYPDIPVLRNITFDLPSGDFLSLLGPNGCGKSTLLRLLDRILLPQSGTISLDGRPLNEFSRRELVMRIAYVPQDTLWVFPYTVLEVVLMGRSPYVGHSGFENDQDFEIARDAMRLTDIDHLADKLITGISGGERQRVLIARALSQQPKILLLDEPNAHLDISHQIEIFQILREENHQRNLTIVSVSHDLNLAAAFSKRTLLLENTGKEGASIFALGQPQDVLTRENIEQVYRTPVLVDQLPDSSALRISLLPLARKREKLSARIEENRTTPN